MQQNLLLRMARCAGYINGYFGKTIRKIIKTVIIASIALALLYAWMHTFNYSIEIKKAEIVVWKMM